MQQQPSDEHPEDRTSELVTEAQHEGAAARVPWYRAVRPGRLLLGVYVLLLCLFGLLAWFVSVHPILSLDITITRELQANQAPWLRATMLAVSYIGSTPLLAALVVLAAIIFWMIRLRLEAIMIVGLSGTSALLNELIKVIVHRPRPTTRLVEVLQPAAGASFPSGHVMSYLAFWGVLFSFGIILFKGNRGFRLALLLVPALFVVLVGPSRIYLGDHWASDVLGAYLIGGAELGLALSLYLKLKEKGVLAAKRPGKTPP